MEKSANQIKNGISRVICYVVTKWAMSNGSWWSKISI